MNILRAAEGAASGSAASPAPGTAPAAGSGTESPAGPSGAAPAGASPNGSTPPPAALARPEYIEEKFWDPRSGVRVEELAKSYGEIQRKFSTRMDDLKKSVRSEIDNERLGRRPAAADKYVAQPPKGLLPEGAEFKPDINNPMLKWWNEHAWNSGLSQEDYEKGIAVYIEALGYHQPDPAAEIKKLGDNGHERVNRAAAWAKGNLSDTSYKLVEQLASTADGVKLVEELVRLNSGHAQGAGPGGAISDAPSLESLQQKMKDPRYYDPFKRDPIFVREIEDGFKRLVAAGGGRKANVPSSR